MPETTTTEPPPTPEPIAPETSIVPPPKAPVVPEWKKAIPAKFHAETEAASYAKMAQSYTELEKKLATKPAEPPAPTPLIPAPSGFETILADADFLFSAGSEFASKGKLTDAQYERIKGVGVPAPLADQFFKGQQARLKSARMEADATIGKERHKALLEWGAANEDPVTFKNGLDAAYSDPENKYGNFVKSLQAKFSTKTGDDNPIITGDNDTAPALNDQDIRDLVKKANKGDKQAQAKLPQIDRATFARAMNPHSKR